MAAIERAAQADPYFSIVTSPEVGPQLWASMHTLARTVNSADRSAKFRAWLLALADVMPCPVCATHWAQIAPTFSATTPAAAVKWTIDAHNSVNARLNKPVLSDAQALQRIMTINKSNAGPKGLSTLDIGLIVYACIITLLAIGFIVAFAMHRRTIKKG